MLQTGSNTFFLLYRKRWFVFLLLLSNLGYGQITVSIQSANTNCEASNGFIFATVNGGTEPYLYSLNNTPFQSSALFTGLPAGSYKLKVLDSLGATATVSVVLTNTFKPPDLIVGTIMPPSPCGAFDGSITLGGTGGTPIYSFSVNGIDFQHGTSFTGLSPGGYVLYVRDENGCAAAQSYSFKDNCSVGVTYQYSSDVCNAEGYILITPNAAGALPDTYSLDGIHYQSQPAFYGLVSGQYHLYTKDKTGLVSINALIIHQHCDLPVQTATTDSRCGQKTGSITVSFTGGRPPIFYSVAGRDYKESNVISNLAAGVYTVQIKDANGGTILQPGVIVGEYCPVLKVSSTPSGCTVHTGTITVTDATGTSPLVYSLNGINFQSGKTFSNLAPGVYKVTSKDANKILTTASVTVTTADGPSLSSTVTESGCTVKSGTITGLATGGTKPYTFQLGAGAVQSSGTFSGIASGIYTLKVNDVNGCSDQVIDTITSTPNPSLTVTSAEAGCSVKNGSISVVASGGTAPYTFHLDNNASQPSGNFSNVGSGTYKVQTVDLNGCSAYRYVTVNTTDGPTVDENFTPESCAGMDATIDIFGDDGNPPYQYSINNGPLQASGHFAGLSSGPYTVNVQDVNGCSAQEQIEVTVNNSIQVNAGSSQQVCSGQSVALTGSSNSNNTYTFSWTPSNSLDNPTTLSPVATPTINTEYYLTAVSGICTSVDSVQVTVNALPVANAGNDTAICYNQSIRLNGSGGTIYQWSPPTYLNDTTLADPILTNPVQTTTYQLTVTDDNGCTSAAPASVHIIVGSKPIVFAGNDTSVLLNQPLTLQAIDVNNIGFSIYSWAPSTGLNDPYIASPTYIPSGPQTFVVSASTEFGCSATDTITIKTYKQPDILVPNGFTPNNDGRNDVLHPIPIGIRTLNYFIVYNRYGQKIFMTKDAGNGWDGRINGQDQNTGTYVWMASGIDFTGKLVERKGVVVLIR